MHKKTAGRRQVRAPRGSELSCKGWLQEAALRMICNNLDPEVAEKPDELVVYGGTGKAARNWDAFEAIVRSLKELEADETLLVQSGKPVGIFRTHTDAPRVLIANSNLVGDWATWDKFRELERKGLISREKNRSRAIRLLKEPADNRGLPYVGDIAAGTLHEAIEQNERIDIGSMFEKKNRFVLRVSGDSMIEAQICDGDYVVVKKQHSAHSGDIVVALTGEGDATLKYWFPEKSRIRLQPANSEMKPIYVRNAKVLGIVVGVVRDMN